MGFVYLPRTLCAFASKLWRIASEHRFSHFPAAPETSNFVHTHSLHLLSLFYKVAAHWTHTSCGSEED